jgi:hypothetical protein
MSEKLQMIFGVLFILLLIAVFGVEGTETEAEEEDDKAFIHIIDDEQYICMSEEQFDDVLEIIDERDVLLETKADLSSALQKQEQQYMDIISQMELEQKQTYWRGFGTGAGIVGGVLLAASVALTIGLLTQ